MSDPPDILSQAMESDYVRKHRRGVVIPMEDRDDQMHVFLDAYDIYKERNAVRQDAWRDAGWKGQLVEMRKKLDRLWAVWRRDGTVTTEKDIDEALDLINATAFFIRCVREENPDGNWPWPT
jgi:hypothetical protein